MREILRRHSFSIAFITLLFVFFFSRPGTEDGLVQLSGLTMGTSYHLQYANQESLPERVDVHRQVNALLNHLDKEVFSTYAPESELSRFNQAEVGAAVKVSAELLEVARLAQEVSRASAGAFDITVAPLVNLWGFGPGVNAGNSVLPSDAAIADALASVGYEKLEINPAQSTLRKAAAVTIDMSAIAKGYAVDQLALLFERLGINNYFLEVGGEIRLRGMKPESQAWVPAIERPVSGGATPSYRRLQVSGMPLSLAGSGDYRNYFEQDGQRYSHEIDPRSGRPINHSLAAVHVIDSSTARADAWATAYMVLGFEAGRELADKRAQAVYFIYRADSDFAEYASTAFAPYLAPEQEC